MLGMGYFLGVMANVLAIEVVANFYAVLLAIVIVLGLIALFWRRTGRIETKLGNVELRAGEVQDALHGTREAAVVAAAKAVTVADEMKHVIGTPNGHGNVAQMLEHLIEGQAAMSHRISDIETRSTRRHDENRAAIAALGARISTVATRVDDLDPIDSDLNDDGSET